MPGLSLFALSSSREAGLAVARKLGLELAPAEERDFEDGEHKSRPLVSVRGRDVFVLESLHADSSRGVNDKLCRLLFFLGALRDASAASVTAVVPYLAYARKERKTQTRDPVTTRYVAMMFEAVGVSRVVALDVHELAGFQNAFRCPTDHLEARRLLVEEAQRLLQGAEAVAVVSPDPGGIKRAEIFRKSLSRRIEREVSFAVMEKTRALGVVAGEALVGNVRGRTAVIVDDLIATGGTLVRAASACRARGATRVLALATHGLFVGDASATLADPVLDAIVVTDSVPPFRLQGEARRKLTVLETAPLIAEAIARIHGGGSLAELLEV